MVIMRMRSMRITSMLMLIRMTRFEEVAVEDEDEDDGEFDDEEER